MMWRWRASMRMPSAWRAKLAAQMAARTAAERPVRAGKELQRGLREPVFARDRLPGFAKHMSLKQPWGGASGYPQIYRTACRWLQSACMVPRIADACSLCHSPVMWDAQTQLGPAGHVLSLR